MYRLSLILTVLLAGLLPLAACASPATTVETEAAEAQAVAAVRLDPAALSLDEGELAEVRVLVENVTDLAGAEVHLSFDPDVVEVVDADPDEEGIQIAHGGFLDADFVAQNRADPSTGRIDYAVARMPPHEPADGSGPLAVITLRLVGSGEAVLTLQDVLLADPEGYPIPVETVFDTLSVTSSASSP
jgi:hypothetical protein